MSKRKDLPFFSLTKGAYSALKKKINKMKEEDIPGDEIKTKKPHESKQRVIVDISVLSVAKATIVVILLYAATQFVVSIYKILIIFFVSLLFASAIDPWIEKLEKRKIPRGISVVLLYLVLFAVLYILVVSLVPLIASQVGDLAERIQVLISNMVTNGDDTTLPFMESLRATLKTFVEDLDTQILIENASSSLSDFSKSLGDVAGNIWEAIKGLFDGLFNFFMVLFITYFMAVDSRGVEAFIKKLFPSRHGKYIADKSIAFKEKIGYWLRGQLLLMISVGLLTFIGLSIIGIQYTATLALVAGVTEIIPVAGPIIAFFFALPIAANESIWMVGWLALVFVIVQQFENNILVPVIMKKSVGLSPIVIMFAMLVGFHFLNILGIILSVPVASTVNIFLSDYLEKEK